MNKRIKLGFGLTGSFCTWEQVVPVMERLAQDYDILPILSEQSYITDTRFGNAADWIERIEGICGKKVLHQIKEVEPIGPRNLLDIMLVAPCTGNTLGKLANSIIDTSVCMASKSCLRNGNPVVLAVSTNDALAGSAKNIGMLMNIKNIYFVPMTQDDPIRKPTSMVADFDRIPMALQEALKGRQAQPVYF